MITYTTGDLLQSPAEALVNTVNCEGYMGKGIAYQFKLQFPENNISYIRACKSGELVVGKLHSTYEKGKLIINFPTKNKWRADSKIEYIQDGLKELVRLIIDKDIKTIAIPPLGSGNGGLIWSEVKKVIEESLLQIPNSVSVYIYEPSKSYQSAPSMEPRLSASALVLMLIKQKLVKFSTMRLQKTAYFINVFAEEQYFRFSKHKYGPYDHSIEVISSSIREFQKYYCVEDTSEAYRILSNKIVSDSVTKKIERLMPSIDKAATFVNCIHNNHELEAIATVHFIISHNNGINEENIINNFIGWSVDKANRFNTDDIVKAIQKLVNENIIQQTLVGYTANIV